ncbi:MAG: EAL domain-containing protein [Cellvibrionaceae bacterium]|nr:EAL domain-containing protein [Cellvibrionaceae bacterium]
MQGSFKGISFRLAKFGLMLAIAVGSLMSGLQLYLDFQAQQEDVAKLIASIMRVSKPPASRAVYTLDNMLAAEVTEGLMMYEFIVNVAIEDENGNILASASKPKIDTNTRWFTQQLSKSFDVTTEKLRMPGEVYAGAQGLLKIVVDMDATYQSFYSNGLVVITIGFLHSTILVIFLFITFYFLHTKPLGLIVVQIKNINPGSPGEHRLSLPKNRQNDELGQFISTANQLLDAIDLALSKRRAVEGALRKSEEHVKQIIDSLPVWVGARNKDGYYIFANKALASFLNTTPEEMRGSHISDFSEYFLSDPDEVTKLDTEVIQSKSSVQVWEERWLSTDNKEYQMHTHVMPMAFFYDEVVALVVSSDITELKKAQAQMEYMAYHDSLTDLPNRSYLVEKLDQEIQLSLKNGVFGALLFIDLDNFKLINDSLGHPAGDGILVSVAGRLLENVGRHDIVARLGGDEFVIVLTNLGRDLPSSISRAEDISERIRKYIAVSYKYDDLNLHLTCSVGIVMFPEKNAGVHELLKYADTAMYQVKEQGRNAIQFFNRYMEDKARNVLVMNESLHKALRYDQFSLCYQPRVKVSDSKVAGAEALLRWRHPKRGMVSPAEFIPILETSGLIVEVGIWVLERSLRQVNEWRKQGLWTDGMTLGVNISPRQFRSSNFVERVIDLLDRENFPPRLLEMEITEGMFIHNLEETISTMATLRSRGINFSLDDFGTGYSSISYLKKLPVSILKIDQSFVRDITVDRNDRVLVETISAMANLLSLEVVAEGVETSAHFSLIKQYECTYYQGHFCSSPVPPEIFSKLLLDDKVG